MGHRRIWLLLFASLLFAPHALAAIQQVNLKVEGMT